MTTNKLSRREFLKLSGVAAAGAILASCAPKATPTPAPTTAPTTAPGVTEAPTQAPPPKKIEGTVVVMHQRNEWSEAQDAQLKELYPDITLEFIQNDVQRFFAMLAAGAQLDLYRTQAPIIPQLLARKLLYDMTPYFETSEAIHVDDLAPANKSYWAKSALEVGEGNIYGMVKDWSPDFTVFINDALFEAASVTPPDDTTPLTYQQVHEYATQVAKFEGQRIATWGYGYANGWVDRIWMNCLAETGKSLYKNSFAQVDFGDDTKALAKYYFDIANENLCESSRNPSPQGWAGGDFPTGVLAMMQYGYWFSAMAEGDPNRGKVRMLPAPTWSGDHSDPCMTATGMVMISKTQNPDATWKVFEWYNSGQPALDRAGSGWGVPAFISWYDKMPKETPFQQQVQKVLAGEMAVADKTLQFNPFLGEAALYNAWNTHLNEALSGTITFDQLCSLTESDVNTLIQEGIDRIGG